MEQRRERVRILGIKPYTSTPCCGERPDSEPALRERPDTLTLPSSLTWKDAWASLGAFFVTEVNE